MKVYDLCGYTNCFKKYTKMRGFMPCCEYHLKHPKKCGNYDHKIRRLDSFQLTGE